MDRASAGVHELGDGYHGQERHRGPDLVPRMKDMADDGIDVEVIYPTQGGYPT
jgi:hypothetical protein